MGRSEGYREEVSFSAKAAVHRRLPGMVVWCCWHCPESDLWMVRRLFFVSVNQVLVRLWARVMGVRP